MKTYHLIQKITDESCGAWARIALAGKLKCELRLNTTQIIRRYESKKHMFYVHITNAALTKVCVYERRKK